MINFIILLIAYSIFIFNRNQSISYLIKHQYSEASNPANITINKESYEVKRIYTDPNNGMSIVKNNRTSKYGIIRNDDKTFITEDTYDQILDMYDSEVRRVGITSAQKNLKPIILDDYFDLPPIGGIFKPDKSPDKVKRFEINSVDTSDILFFAKKDSKWGAIDRHGNIVIDFLYDKIEGNFATKNDKDLFEKRYIIAKKQTKNGSKYGIISSQGELIVDFNIDYIKDYHPADKNIPYVFEIQIGPEKHYIDCNGNYIEVNEKNELLFDKNLNPILK